MFTRTLDSIRCFLAATLWDIYRAWVIIDIKVRKPFEKIVPPLRSPKGCNYVYTPLFWRIWTRTVRRLMIVLLLNPMHAISMEEEDACNYYDDDDWE